MIILSTGANGVLNSLMFVKAYTTSLEEQSIAIGQSLKQQLDRLLNLDIPLRNLEGFDKQCKELVLKYNDIEYSMVVDSKGKILFHSDAGQHGRHMDIAASPPRSTSEISTIRSKKSGADTIIETHIPVIDRHQEFLGYIIVGLPESIIIRERNQLLCSSFFTAAFFIMAAALILFLIISACVTRPIGNFIEHIQNLRELGHGHANTFNITPGDEIGKLHSAFMELIQDLETSQATIRNHALELEEVVEKRTEELQQANDQLKQDILRRRKAEEALKESEERSKTIIDAVQTGIIITLSENNTIVDANPTALKLLDTTLQAIKGKDSRCFIHSAYPQKKSALAPDTTIEPLERTLELKSGEKIPIFMTATPIMLNSRLHVIESFVDLRQLKAAEKERDKLERQLRQSQKIESIGTLAGGIAHGFNNILASIIGYTELVIQDVEKDSIVEKNLQKIFMAAIRARDLVKQILTFARQTDDELQPIRVDTIAKEALKLIRSTIPVTTKISQNITSTEWIMGNPAQVHQIFMNLCTNAAQAMEEKGGQLMVDIADAELYDGSPVLQPKMTPGKYLKIVVSDSGPGIPVENLELIFEPYFTTKKIGEGTGMGLAMVHGIVERYGGKITVASENGNGARFTIYLPTTEIRDKKPTVKKAPLPTGKERILLVDDEALIVEMGNDILKRLGYHITTFTSSLEAIEYFRSDPNAFDLIITDMTMPEMTGVMLVEQVMGLRPDIPIILCTGYSSKISDETALPKGIKAFAYKPIIQDDLAKTVRRVLDENTSG